MHTQGVNLVDVKVGLVRVGELHLLVLALERNLERPREGHAAGGEGDARHPRGDVAGLVARGPDVRHVDGRHVAEGVADGEADAALLGGLAEGGRDPAQDDVVDSKRLSMD